MFTQYMNSFWQAVLSFFSPENLILWWGKFITIIIIIVVVKIALSVIIKLIEKSLTPLKKSKNYKKRISRAKTLNTACQKLFIYCVNIGGSPLQFFKNYFLIFFIQIGF